jgi:5'-AMP-activated protein kinase, catalytic alpha subunit
MIGVDPAPIDTAILNQVAALIEAKPQYVRQCLEANKHNHITASYYLMLKKHLRDGKHSVADARMPTYDKSLFAITPNVVTKFE